MMGLAKWWPVWIRRLRVLQLQVGVFSCLDSLVEASA
jgi:hypothetical protein